MAIQINGLSFHYEEKHPILEQIELEIASGQFVGLIGPNGSGKSTLLKLLYKALKPEAGFATLYEKDLFAMKPKDIARQIGVVGQENHVAFDFTVEEIVAMGRNPHKSLWSSDTKEDRYMVHHALEHLGLVEIAKKSFRQLSGGEKQRVLLARVVAQDTKVLFLDEPTNHLDIGYQLQIFDFVKRLKVTVLSAIHDLNMASLYCDKIYALKDGKIYAQGTPDEVFTEKTIEELYGVRAYIDKNHPSGKLYISYLPQSIQPERSNSLDEKVYYPDVYAVVGADLL